MTEFGIPTKLINVTKATLNKVKCRVRIQKNLSEQFVTQKGLQQGNVLACLLFNIALEKVVRHSGIERRCIILYKSTQLLSYADDIDIIEKSEKAIIEAFVKLEKAAQQIGLKINEDETKYMDL
jgi:sorting nexin-29